jgi:uncharacterized membrane protein (DUF485 family)
MLTKINSFAENLNKSKYFAGIIMIMLNIFSKYITIKLSKTQEAYLTSNIARQLLIFSIFWMGTHDIFISIIMTGIFVVLTNHLFNEESNLCIIPKHLRQYADLIDTNDDGVITPEELENAKRVLEKAEKKEKRKKHLQQLDNFQSSII